MSFQSGFWTKDFPFGDQKVVFILEGSIVLKIILGCKTIISKPKGGFVEHSIVLFNAETIGTC